MGHRLGADREHGPRRERPRRQPGAAQLPHPGLRRRAAHRGVVRRHLRHASGRWAPNRRANARSTRSRRRSPTRIANATGVRFAASAVDAGPHLRRPRRRAGMSTAGGRGRPTIVTADPPVRRSMGRQRSRPGRSETSRHRRRRSRLHRADGDAAQPAGADRLGDPAAFRRPRSALCLAAFRTPAATRCRTAQAHAGRRRRRPSRRRRRDAGALPSPVSAVISTRRQAGRGSRLPRAGNSALRRRRRARRAFRATGSSRRSRACRTTGWRSCGSTPRTICKPGWTRRRGHGCCSEAGGLHRRVPHPHRAHRLRPMVRRDRRRRRARRRRGSRT